MLLFLTHSYSNHNVQFLDVYKSTTMLSRMSSFFVFWEEQTKFIAPTHNYLKVAF